MAYFNHAFTKLFLGIGATRNLASTGGPETVTNPYSSGGYITTAGVTTETLSKLGPGYYGFFDPNSYVNVTEIEQGNACCPLILASSSILANDKVGPFHGGYLETNKSKLINPKYVQKFYHVNSCQPEQAVISIGTTPETITPGLPTDRFQSGTMQSNCCYNFLCGETYYLRIDVKGSPALRALNHNAYQTVYAYTGCCSDQDPLTAPTNVDPTTVYVSWAAMIIQNNYLKNFVLPVVFDYTGAPWYAPGTTVDIINGLPIPTHTAADGTLNVPNTWDTYAASQTAANWTNECTAGMRLFGAYVETKFLNCSFQITDFFEKEPLRIYASLVDYNGDPCTFEGLCVYNDCYGLQGIGFGEQVVRDLILSQSYLQNFFHTDIRIREITQGNQMLDAAGLNRLTGLYDRYYLLHSVPRFNNPTGTFDNDRYMLEVITNGPVIEFSDFVQSWLGNCPNCVGFEDIKCTPCDYAENFPVI